MKTQHLKWIALASLFLALATTGCRNGGMFCMAPKGPDVTVTIPVPDFDGIDLAIASDVTLHKGEAREVKVTGAQNIIDNIERNVNGGVWKIRFDECVRNDGNLHIDITLPFLRSVEVSGSGNVTGMDTFSGLSAFTASIAGSGTIDVMVLATDVDASIAGSGDIHLYTQAAELSADIAGSGSFFLSGSATDQTFGISGSGDIHAFPLAGLNGTVHISGSGNCDVNVSTKLDVTISGSGNVRYRGTPAVSSHISGSGSVSHDG
jgi:hypothetical protein